ncbi:hypothetical protein FDECE_4344 [Fusarium decemcellulare]|nr:hypothetical protein FDECE_4344 [Fusarium decemcellulare]
MADKRLAAEPVDPSLLGQPLKFEFSGRTAPNRILKASMTERLSTWDPNKFEARGIPTTELINVYKRWGEGGFGVVLTGNIMIEYDHIEAAGNIIIPQNSSFSGERFEAFRTLAKVSKAHGSLVMAQLNHPGRQAASYGQSQPISASDVQLDGEVMGKFKKPRPMVQADFKAVIDKFTHAAQYCYKAGFDGVELHGAHGYLLAQFISQTTNKRTDKYGGSIRSRARIIFEIADAIRDRIKDPSFCLGIKMNSVEFQQENISAENCKLLCIELEKHSFDFVELSGATYRSPTSADKSQSTKKREIFFQTFADMIIPGLKKTKVYVTGGLRTTQAMVKALGVVDGVGIARPAANEFDLAKKLLRGNVQSTVDNLISDEDFGLSTIAAGSQMRLVGRDKQPLDLSREDHREAFDKSLQQWKEEMAQNGDNSKFGFVDIISITLKPFSKA